MGGGGWVLVIGCGSGSAGWEVLVGGWWVLLDGWLVWWCLGGGGWVVVVVVGGGGGGWWWVMVGGHGWWWVVVTPHLHFGSEEGPYLVSRVVPHLRGERTLKTLSNCNGICSLFSAVERFTYLRDFSCNLEQVQCILIMRDLHI